MPPVVLTATKICGDAGEVAVCGEPLLPDLLISRELLNLAGIPGLKENLLAWGRCGNEFQDASRRQVLLVDPHAEG